MIQGIGRVNRLGEIAWSDQTVNRLAASGIGVGFGFGVGIILALLFPSIRTPRSYALTLAAAGAGLAVASSVIPVEGAFLDKLSLVSGVLTGRQLAVSMYPAKPKVKLVASRS